MLAAAGAGWRPDVSHLVSDWVRTTPAAEPGPAARRYEVLHARYRDLYPALKPSFDAVAE